MAIPSHDSAPTLLEVARRFGTPTYAFNLRRMREQVQTLRTALPSDVDVFYSLKANASLGLCEVFAECGLGADVASAGELATAVQAGFPASRIFVAGPFKLPETIEQLRNLPDAVVSIDSVSELESFARTSLPNPAVLRLRPDFQSSAVVAAGCESRFGILLEDIPRCRPFVGAGKVDVIGFHVFAGSQVLDAEAVVEHLRGGFDLSLRAADALGIRPAFLNLGGGFGTPYGPTDKELDLACVGEALESLVERASPGRVVLELGRYFVAQAGWYLTSVVGAQRFLETPAVVVDGGTHQRADLCGLCLRSRAYPPLALDASTTRTASTTVLGCLSLPADVLCEAAELPELRLGNVLAFANAGAYGLWSSPASFHASPMPAEIAFDGNKIHLMRARSAPESILDGQRSLRPAMQPAQV